MKDVVLVSGVRMSINYGLNRVRFVSPVPLGQPHPRAGLARGTSSTSTAACRRPGTITVEREGGEKPCLVAEWLVRYYQ